MKRLSILSILVPCFVLLTGVSAQEPLTRNLGDFAGLSVIGGIKAELYKSDRPYVEVYMKNASADQIITEVKSGVLSLRLKTNTPKEAEILVKVFYSSLDQINAQAQCLITSTETLTGKNMSFDAKSGGEIDLIVELTGITAKVTQGAIMVFEGTVEKQEITVNTGGTYSAYELESRDTYVTASSGGKAKVTANRIIDATANAKGWIGYKGSPVSTYIKTNLGGEIAIFREGDPE